MKLTIECEMPEAWLNCFLSMLNDMETLGRIEASAIVGMFVDGSNGFTPYFRVRERQTRVNENGSVSKVENVVSIKRYKDTLPYGIHIKTNSDAGQKYYHTAIVHRPSWENHEWDEPHWKKLKMDKDGNVLPEVEYEDVEGYEDEDEIEESQESVETEGISSQDFDSDIYRRREEHPQRSDFRDSLVETDNVGKSDEDAESSDHDEHRGVGSFKKRDKRVQEDPKTHDAVPSGPIIRIQRGGVHDQMQHES